MRLPWTRGQRTGAPARPPQDEEAYLLLEEARLRCLRLREDARTDARRQELDLAYREIGMAGYMASSRIPSHRRLRLLAQAQSRARAREGARDGSAGAGDQPGREIEHGLRALMAVVPAAAAAVERALVAPGITDHVQTASEHLVRARLALGDLLAAPVPAPSALSS